MKAPLLLTAACLLLAAPARADDVKSLLCTFRYGQIKVDVNYTGQTVNGVTAIINDKEIVWTPPGKDSGIAVINRYSGKIQISRGGQEDTGICKLMPAVRQVPLKKKP